MLAYSSIGHTGFALLAVVSFNGTGFSALTYYLAAYGIANICALALATYFSNVAGAVDMNGYRGLGLKYPAASVCFVIALVSLTGLPISAGFTGKLFVFSAVYVFYQQTHSLILMAMMIIGALITVVSLFYYIKIPLNLFIKRADVPVNSTTKSTNILILALVLSILILIILSANYFINVCNSYETLFSIFCNSRNFSSNLYFSIGRN